MDNTQVFYIQPNKWVTERKLTEITGLRHGTIEVARKKSWMVGREYLHIAADGDPKPNSECMYNLEAINRWIEVQAKRQPKS